jgi:hypothetical protein
MEHLIDTALLCSVLHCFMWHGVAWHGKAMAWHYMARRGLYATVERLYMLGDD